MSLRSEQINLNDLPIYIHQAALDPHLSKESLNEICDACIHFKFSGLCTNSVRLSHARNRISSQSRVKLISVIAFPFGCVPFHLKKLEAEWAISEGADELELVPNFLALNERNGDTFAEEIAELCQLGLPVRTILDLNNLSSEKLSFAVNASIEAGATSIQIGTGLGPTIDAAKIKKLHEEIKGRCAIKVVGGIKNIHQLVKLIKAGASQVGTSYGLSIIQEAKNNEQYE